MSQTFLLKLTDLPHTLVEASYILWTWVCFAEAIAVLPVPEISSPKKMAECFVAATWSIYRCQKLYTTEGKRPISMVASNIWRRGSLLALLAFRRPFHLDHEPWPSDCWPSWLIPSFVLSSVTSIANLTEFHFNRFMLTSWRCWRQALMIRIVDSCSCIATF